MRVKSVGIVGGGSAGFIAALTLRERCPDLAITLIKSPKIPIIGVGEATTAYVPGFLRHWCNLPDREFFREVQPSWKLGARFYWGKLEHFDYAFQNDMILEVPGLSRNCGQYSYLYGGSAAVTTNIMNVERSPFVPQGDGSVSILPEHGYHIENRRFVGYIEKVAKGRGITVIEKTVRDYVLDPETGDLGKLIFEEGDEATFDLYVDCSGFKSDILGTAMGEPFIDFSRSLLCRRSVVGGWERSEDEPIRPYTGAYTMQSGWMFRTEHWDLVNCGYVFSPDFISDEEAVSEYHSKCLEVMSPKSRARYPSLSQFKPRFVDFKSGYYKRGFVKNVIAIGNSSGFVEPLESTGLFMICKNSQMLSEAIRTSGGELNDHFRQAYNRLNAFFWDDIRQFLVIHYKFNNRIDNPFWRANWHELDESGLEETLAHFRACGPTGYYFEARQAYTTVFGTEGYLTMLVGLRAPTDSKPKFNDAEVECWRQAQKRARAVAQGALSMEQAQQYFLDITA